MVMTRQEARLRRLNKSSESKRAMAAPIPVNPPLPPVPPSWIATALIAAGSAFFGALVAIFSEPLRKWIFKPCLVAEFRGDRDDFVVRTPVRHKDAAGVVVLVHEAFGVRGYVRNTGRTTAYGCCAWLTNIEKKNPTSGAYDQTPYREIIPLQWSNCPNREDKYDTEIARGMGQYFDLLMLNEGRDDIYVRVESMPFRFEPLLQEKGTFRFTVMVAGDGFHPITIRIALLWKGLWDDFKVWPD